MGWGLGVEVRDRNGLGVVIFIFGMPHLLPIHCIQGSHAERRNDNLENHLEDCSELVISGILLAWLGKIDVWIWKTENLTLRLFQYMCMVHCFIKLVNIEEKI